MEEKPFIIYYSKDITDDEYDEMKGRRDRGVALLDRILPDWHEKIDLDVFDIANAETCVLGQTWMVHNGFENGFDAGVHDLVDRDPDFNHYEHGFNLEPPWAERDDLWELLAGLWAMEVHNRRQEKFIVEKYESAEEYGYNDVF